MTLLGATVGGSVGAAFVMLGAFSLSDTLLVASLVMLPVFELAGGMYAYERSHRRATDLRTPLPALRAERGGASLALSGMF